jgi:hypothetical protein
MRMKIGLLLLITAPFVGGAYWVTANFFFLESAEYSLVSREGDFELRDYPELTVASTPAGSSGEDPAFNRLFQFIQGGNNRQEKISMTTPVLIGNGQMSFVIPSEFDRKGVPDPAHKSVLIESRPAVRVAAYRFSGVADETLRGEALHKLEAWIARQQLTAQGDPTFAYYDAPFIPGPFRRNEVMLQVR